MRTCALVFLVGIGAFGLAGCSSPECTAIGAASGVSVDLGQRMSRDWPATQVCAAGTCAAARPVREHSLWAPLGSLASTDDVKVQVKVAGRTVLDRTVTPTKLQPNGPSCPPSAYQATVVLPVN